MLIFIATATAGGVSTLLPAEPGLHDRWDAGRAWGTPLLVDTLLSTFERLAWDHPSWDPPIVGDLSTRGGGPMFGHKTHDRGIDADLSLYVEGARTEDGFEDIHPRRLDPHANWTLIKSLLDSGNVQFILLDQGHIDRIASHLVDQGYDPGWVRSIFIPAGVHVPWSARGVVRHAPKHRSHLHVRVARPRPAAPTN